jgi:hypothetical protein|tara:strand:+ start:740 stop:1186 length:447 start_codon:yes stop_codon:yes gene_type:complete
MSSGYIGTAPAQRDPVVGNDSVGTSKIQDDAVTAAKVADNTFVALSGATGSGQLPSGTTAERDGSPSAGFMRFNSTTTGFEGYNGSAWGSIGGGATGAGGDEIFYENEQSVTTNYTLTSNENAMSAGPITINNGITVTVPSGSTWVIV